VVALQTNRFTNYETAQKEMRDLNDQLKDREGGLKQTPFIVICDDSSFVADSLNNYLWVTYTRCNPSHDIYGINAFTSNKHWGCSGPLIIDARIKKHHAPPVEKDAATEKKIDRLFSIGGSLYGKL
jgi:4-hydroxy-3-polyprenylbenzoate decarboxylase